MTNALNHCATLAPTLEPITAAQHLPPTLLIVVDTEEEFDWALPHDRQSVAVSAMEHVGHGQEVFDEFGARPCYVVDYPVASQRQGYAELARVFADGRCEIGAHLHPWVTPPHEETVCRELSFPGNLPVELEHQKLSELTETIATTFGKRPKVYKAGRYGLGRNSLGVLQRLGYEVDLSVTPGFDYSNEGGPNYLAYPNSPQRLPDSGTLELACTGGFVGALRARGAWLYPKLTAKPLTQLRVPGIAARLGLLERIRLSPEGYTLAELKRLTRCLYADGHRVFTLSYHSPSLKPGCTPYVQTETELKAFLATIRGFLQFFADELQGGFSTPLELKNRLLDGPRSEMAS